MIVDQDGLSIAIALLAASILISGLRRGDFTIQFVRASRTDRPLAYWAVAIILLAVTFESARRAFFIGCVDC